MLVRKRHTKKEMLARAAEVISLFEALEHYTQKSIAETIGCREQHISRWKRGTLFCPDEFIEKLKELIP